MKSLCARRSAIARQICKVLSITEGIAEKCIFQGITYDCAMAGAVSAVTDSLTDVHGEREWTLKKRTVDRAVSVVPVWQ